MKKATAPFNYESTKLKTMLLLRASVSAVSAAHQVRGFFIGITFQENAEENFNLRRQLNLIALEQVWRCIGGSCKS